MKALMLAAVMALGATGASALDTNTLLTKGTVIAAFSANGKAGSGNLIWISYKGEIYSCLAEGRIICAKANNSSVMGTK